jgi:hypothetical protein
MPYIKIKKNNFLTFEDSEFVYNKIIGMNVSPNIPLHANPNIKKVQSLISTSDLANINKLHDDIELLKMNNSVDIIVNCEFDNNILPVLEKILEYVPKIEIFFDQSKYSDKIVQEWQTHFQKLGEKNNIFNISIIQE